MKKFLFPLLLLPLLASCSGTPKTIALAAAAPAADPATVCQTGKPATVVKPDGFGDIGVMNVRSGASMQSSVLFALPLGTKILAGGFSGQWTAVCAKPGAGWEWSASVGK